MADVLDRMALSHPEVAVRFIREGKETLSAPGDGKLLSAIYAVYGREFASGLIPVDYESDGVCVSGFVSKPMAARKSRSMQLFFLNGRFVKTGTASAALNEAYRNSIMVGKYPACVCCTLNFLPAPLTSMFILPSLRSGLQTKNPFSAPSITA